MTLMQSFHHADPQDARPKRRSIQNLFSKPRAKSRAGLVIGFDIGTTSVKGSVIDAKGQSVSSYSASYAKSFPRENWVEQAPDDWTNHISDALAKFSKDIKLKDVSAICLCSQVNTHVFVNAKGDVLYPAIVWSDTRAKTQADAINGSFTVDQKQEIWGFDFVVDASYALSRAVWMCENEPQIWSKTRWILSPKDYCNMWLTGAVASDPFSSVGLAAPNGEYVQGLDQKLVGFTEKLPPLQDMFSPVGVTALKQFPQLKAQVFTGTMDAWANFIGSGVVEAGRGALITGTSSIVGVMSEESRPATGVITFPPFRGYMLHAGPTQAGSDAYTWFAKIAGRDLDEFTRQMADRKITRSSILFLPHLQGERAPLWDPNARGTFVGLNASHDLIDMALAVMEGVAFSERHLFEECSKAAGFQPGALRLSGGSSVNDLWSQLRADRLKTPLERLRLVNSGVLGAVLIAHIGMRTFSDLSKAVEAFVFVKHIFTPQPGSDVISDERYAFYRSAYQQLNPLFDDMAEVREG